MLEHMLNKKKNKINIEVSLASQTHQIPHVGLPHKDPVAIEINVKIAPIGAKLFVINGIIFILNIKFKMDPVPIIENMPKARKDEGTWTYIILTESPWI